MMNAYTAVPDSTIVEKVSIHGRRHLSTTQIVESLGIKQNSSLPKDWPDQSIENLLDAYRSDGYFEARVDSVRSDQSENGRIRLDVWLTEGPVARTGDIRIRVDGNESRELREILDMDPGSPFIESRLQSGMSRILSHLADRGRPLASVAVQSVYPAPDGSGIDADLDVTAGPQVTIGGLNTSGNTLTRKRVILRETRLKPGQVFRTRNIEAATANLRRLGFFKDVRDPELRFHGAVSLYTSDAA
ncbi:MAG: POTRA domain-containing protein, partial [bacterium]|nr:POTRA domain-containing protein [bacterium]